MTTSDVAVRSRAATDIPGCVDALRLVHEVDRYPTRWPPDPSAWLTPKAMQQAWVAVEGERIVGHVAVTVVAEPTEIVSRALAGSSRREVRSISRLFVAPAGRGRGVAGRLLDVATASARNDDADCVLDVVADGLAAIALYERRGWRRVGSGPAHWVNAAGEHPLVHYYVGP